MVTKDGQIIKIDAKTSFLDIREAFVFGEEVVGLVCFQFRTYDKNRPAGQKITQKTDIYMDLEEFSYLCEILASGKIHSLCQMAKQQNNFGAGYHNYGGNKKAQTSRQLKIELGSDNSLWMKALEGPAKMGEKGQIIPAYKDNEATTKIAMKIDCETAMKIGLAGKRAIQVFDHWDADGVVKEKVSAFHKQTAKSKADDSGFYPDYIPDYDHEDLPENRY